MRTNHRGILCTAFIALTMAVAFIVGLSGCVGVNISSEPRSFRTIEGEGEMITKDFDVGEFDRILIDGDYALTYKKAEIYSVSVEMQESLFEYLDMKVEDGRLRVYSEDGILRNAGGSFRVDAQDGIEFENGSAPRITVSAPTLAGMEFSGAVMTEDSDPIAGEKFRLFIGGGGAVKLDLAVEALDVTVAGAASIELAGTATDAVFSMSGAGYIDALELQTKTAEVNLAGSGSGSVSCSDALDVTISGLGSFDYRGDPEVKKNIAGLGSVQRVD